MRFYRNKDLEIICSVCADRVDLPTMTSDGEPSDLAYIGIGTEAAMVANPFKCVSCNERFVVIDGCVYREIQ